MLEAYCIARNMVVEKTIAFGPYRSDRTGLKSRDLSSFYAIRYTDRVNKNIVILAFCDVKDQISV